MSIVFADHAKKQIEERKILKNQIVSTVKNPESKEKSFKNRLLRRKVFDDKILEVVTITEGSKITIVTAYYLKESYEN